jgi:5-(carboxyamino)imidazole ribonucleotide synthase
MSWGFLINYLRGMVLGMKELLSKKVGIIGGGQLGKMMVAEASKMGIYTIVLDPSRDCPAGSLADELITAGFDDEDALRTMALRADVMTYEFEHISTTVLKSLEEEGYSIYPSVKSLEIIQNKFTQKLELQKHGISIGNFLKVDSVQDIQRAASKFDYPLMLKSAVGGYDGKGNYLVREEAHIETAYEQLGGGNLPLYVEKYVPFIKEISVLCCRGLDGEVRVYPVAENVHRESILYETSVPADITSYEEKKALLIARQVCEAFEGVGMFCVEMFLAENGEVMVNEVAPRPHNSGHYTIEGCVTSQFENHLRAVVGLPLGDTSLLKPTVMRNILGEAGHKGQAKVTGTYDALTIPEVHLHIYGKKYTQPQRKMGHITVTASTVPEARKRADKAHGFVKIISE